MSMKLYVGNLAFATSSQDLQELFAAAGTVESASVVEDRDTGRSRGFGFVEMSSKEEGEAATAAAITAATTTTTAAIFAGLGFVDVQGATVHFLAVKLGDSSFALFLAGHFDEAKSARASGVAVFHDAGGGRGGGGGYGGNRGGGGGYGGGGGGGNREPRW